MKRPYRHIHLAWNDPDARRAYDREQQRKWRANKYARKQWLKWTRRLAQSRTSLVMA